MIINRLIDKSQVDIECMIESWKLSWHWIDEKKKKIIDDK